MGLLSTLIGIFSSRLAKCIDPPTLPKDENPLRIGILGAAAIAPQALILPARSHPGVVVQAVAARDEARARLFAATHGIPQVFANYQQMLDSPDIDAIYNPLPNGLHFEWTMKALKAGKHVLLEKPSSNSSEETRQMFALADQKNLVLLEAFHYRFHPANQRFRELVTSGTLGKLQSIEVRMALLSGFFSKDDIRFNYDLGGGATTDMGCYTMSFARWLAGSEPTVELAKPDLFPERPQVDRAMTADLIFRPSSQPTTPVHAKIYCDLAQPWKWGIIPNLPELTVKATCERGTITIDGFVIPTIRHSITIAEMNQPKRSETCHQFVGDGAIGEEWWTTYRYQLEAFVDKVRGREPQFWISGEDSVAQTKALEAVYVKSGLQPRPTSTYKP
ncbi:hypothetical protein FRC17_008953 [Serendipita sp. 399]|nr:hypothetical protein FRC17_008953 [Serendipita sp. 399]